jgi:hypothetical protein
VRKFIGGARVFRPTILKVLPALITERLALRAVWRRITSPHFELVHAARRINGLWREQPGRYAFFTFVLLAPPASRLPLMKNAAVNHPDGAKRLAGSTIAFVLFAKAFLSAAVLTSAGALVAVLIHGWYARHPSEVPTSNERTWYTPQVNFSSMDVAGNVGGLIFVLGSLAIVCLGLRWVFWFLLGGTITGCLLAWRLVSWHARHPKWGLPQNLIVLR